MELTVRSITESEVATFCRKMSRGFGSDPHDEAEATSRLRRILDLERSACAFDGDELIGTCAAFSLEVTVPGRTLPMAGTTMVTVQATHRRRGVLRAMMRAHLEEARGRGEPLAGLWASESAIYGRFGYGLAAEGWETRLDGKEMHFTGARPEGEVRLVESPDAQRLLPGVHERVRPTRPGMLARSDAWWETRHFYDPEHRRKGRSAQRYAIYEGTAGVDGYAVYRQKDKWEDFPEGEVHVIELVAATPEAHAALWRFLTRIDLFPNVRYWNAPVDDELPWRVTEPRRVQRTIGDSLWLRLIDIPRALAGRCYGGTGRLVLGIRDPFLPENDGCYELEAGGDEPRCRRASAEADLELPIDALGALYLGGHRITALARAGIVRGSEGALATCDRLFSWDPLPWCPEDF
ncbi:MAG: GNAT family N-acetyltransferase [Planctomycetota bacterium]|jgi:predicted acetyltransferase